MTANCIFNYEATHFLFYRNRFDFPHIGTSLKWEGLRPPKPTPWLRNPVSSDDAELAIAARTLHNRTRYSNSQ